MIILFATEDWMKIKNKPSPFSNAFTVLISLSAYFSNTVPKALLKKVGNCYFC
jgi:hypothetical protein